MSRSEDRRKRTGEMDERRELIAHYVNICISIAVLTMVIVMCYVGYYFGRELFSTSGMTSARTENIEYMIHIEEGEHTLAVGRELENEGIIRSAAVFLVQTKLFRCTIEPGDYLVNSRQSSREIAKQLNGSFRLKGSE